MTHKSVRTYFSPTQQCHLWPDTPSSRDSSSHSVLTDPQPHTQQLYVILEPTKAHKWMEVHYSVHTVYLMHVLQGGALQRMDTSECYRICRCIHPFFCASLKTATWVVEIFRKYVWCVCVYSTVQYSTVQYIRTCVCVWRFDAICSSHCTVQYSTVQYSTVHSDMCVCLMVWCHM
jgi:hypothetical protein